jgi:hypothetical protein
MSTQPVLSINLNPRRTSSGVPRLQASFLPFEKTAAAGKAVTHLTPDVQPLLTPAELVAATRVSRDEGENRWRRHIETQTEAVELGKIQHFERTAKNAQQVRLRRMHRTVFFRCLPTNKCYALGRSLLFVYPGCHGHARNAGNC